MKYSLIALCLVGVTAAYGQISLPCDFEATPTTDDFTNFDGGMATVIPNPYPDAGNSSSNVARIVRSPGALWSGSLLTLATPAVFGETSGIRMKVWSPEPNVFMRIKFESTQGAVQMDQWLTAAGEWTTLEWDFTNLPSGIYDRLVFMFDVGTQGDGTDNSTFYFDDIAWFDADGDLATPDLPLTWEEPETYYHAYGFEGSAVSFASDPEDATNTVLEVLKTELALDYSGVVLTNRNGLANPIPFSAENQVMQARIWSPDVGLPILMKVENKDDPGIFAQTLATTATVGWDTLFFDFSQPTAGTPPVNLGAAYDLPVVFFNFGWNGALFGPLTFRLDDVKLVGAAEPSSVADAVAPTQLVQSVVQSGSELRWSDVGLHGATLTWFDASGRAVASTPVMGVVSSIPALAPGHYFVSGLSPAGQAVRERVFVTGE